MNGCFKVKHSWAVFSTFLLSKQNLNKVTYVFLSYSSFRAADLSARLLLLTHQLKSHSLVPVGKSHVAQTIYLLHICKLLWNLLQTITPPFEYCALLDSKSSKIFSTYTYGINLKRLCCFIPELLHSNLEFPRCLPTCLVG